MFGDNNNQNTQDNSQAVTGAPTVPAAPTTPVAGSSDIPSFTMDPPQTSSVTTTEPVAAAPAADSFTPPSEPSGAPTTSEPAPAPAPSPSEPNDSVTSSDSSSAASPDNQELVGIKQQALSQLTPMISHLEQTPEEKFKTLMMMIQASDNQSLIKEAYDTIQNIPDEKTKAQALLDIVNEINYFTQQSGD